MQDSSEVLERLDLLDDVVAQSELRRRVVAREVEAERAAFCGGCLRDAVGGLRERVVCAVRVEGPGR